MYFPNPWWSTSECTENMSPEDCEFLSGIPNDCRGSGRDQENGKFADCSQSAGLRDWFTNYTKVAKRTIEDKFVTCEYFRKLPKNDKLLGIRTLAKLGHHSNFEF